MEPNYEYGVEESQSIHTHPSESNSFFSKIFQAARESLASLSSSLSNGSLQTLKKVSATAFQQILLAAQVCALKVLSYFLRLFGKDEIPIENMIGDAFRQSGNLDSLIREIENE